jgi:hypothetical protein
MIVPYLDQELPAQHIYTHHSPYCNPKINRGGYINSRRGGGCGLLHEGRRKGHIDIIDPRLSSLSIIRL